jgi:septin family protein
VDVLRLQDMVDFLGALASMRRPDGKCVNIYVIGGQGTGKGSFINTIFTLLSEGDRVVTEGADVGGGADHQTTQLHSFNFKTMMRSTRLPRFPFRIFDTWGTWDFNPLILP